jgi:hypothetical protein
MKLFVMPLHSISTESILPLAIYKVSIRNYKGVAAIEIIRPFVMNSTLDLADPNVMLPRGFGRIFRKCAKWDCMTGFTTITLSSFSFVANARANRYDLRCAQHQKKLALARPPAMVNRLAVARSWA